MSGVLIVSGVVGGYLFFNWLGSRSGKMWEDE